jgi:pyruvyltransferase
VPVEVVHWNPDRPVVPGRVGRRIPLARPVDNFGDLLGPRLVGRILADRGLDDATAPAARLLTVGSILHLARSGDVVWGSGINGKMADLDPDLALDVRAVRGPVTQARLARIGIEAPSVFGDPALLWGRFWPRSSYATTTTRRVTFVPNMNDWKTHRRDPRAISPRRPADEVITAIAESELVVASSLHAIVVAESFGIPARLVRPGREPMLKYEDHYAGSGRETFHAAATVDEAVALGGEPPLSWDADALLSAFPEDLWPADSVGA